ncbi:MAG TPA: sigma-70 family RNA polymerase sigma factor [Chthoniobacterales bacterium]|nr:sigma-70 family RNA polymerase sigma factor [Chthoniobacterales bacterium]
MSVSSLAAQLHPIFSNMSGNEPGPPGRTPEDAEDIRLMSLAGTGDMTAFEELVERHQRLVVGTVGRMLGTNSDAEDIAQQVFVRVWKNVKRYEPRAKFTTWLLKITRNLVFNELRRRSRHPAVPLQSEIDEEERPLKDESAISPDASLLEHELQEAVDAAIAQLPETQRMAVILRRYEELSYEEIAEALDQSVSAVKSLLFRARTELRESLKRYLDK